MDHFEYHQLLYYAQGAFTIWMLVDAYRRRVEFFWYWIIFTGIGAWAYFFLFKLQDLQGVGGWTLFQRKTSLAELRYRAEQSPTLANHLALAERLIEKGEHAEAVPHLECARKPEPEHCKILYCLALCHTHLGRPELAVPLLETVVRKDPNWSGRSAWRLLIDARARAGDRGGALETCRELVRQDPTLQNRCLLAEKLLDDGLHDEAASLLDKALLDYDYAPGHIRRLNGRWARQARALRKRLPSA